MKTGKTTAISTQPPLVVGSVSPRRHRLLRGLGIEFEILPANAHEIHAPSDPVGTVVHNALAKHAPCRQSRPDACILTADTLVLFEGRLIGKPRDLPEAAGFLRAFSGHTQVVFTAVALSLPGQDPDLRVEASAVHFRTLDENTIQTYLHRTHPLDRAGAYDIDENGDLLIAGYSGSYSNIMGLPIEVVADWLATHGFGLITAPFSADISCKSRPQLTPLQPEALVKPRRREGRVLRTRVL